MAHRARMRLDALFLHDAALDGINDRLAMVNKPFAAPAIVSGYPQIWGAWMPEARSVLDDDRLDLEPGTHDLVIHAMALHWANDPVGQLIQCRRALRSDGLAIVVLLGGQTLSELRTSLAEGETTTSGGLSPRIAPMAEIRDLGGLLQRAGFALPVADSETLTAEYRDIWHLMRDLRAMGETNALDARLRLPTKRAVFDRAQEFYARHFQSLSGRLTACFELIALTGWAPDASQPQPLRPGSAKARLADALATVETPLRN